MYYLTEFTSINEQSLGRSPPKMRATERGVKQAICVSIYDTRCIHSTPPRAFSSNRRHLQPKVPPSFRRNRDWWAARREGERHGAACGWRGERQLAAARYVATRAASELTNTLSHPVVDWKPASNEWPPLLRRAARFRYFLCASQNRGVTDGQTDGRTFESPMATPVT